jgi:hypothetical protein
MATVYGVNKTLSRDPSGSNIQRPGLQAGKVRVMCDTYEAVALAAGSIIEMGDKLPKGAIVIDVKLSHDALGSATVDVGDYEDDNRYMDDESVASANTQHFLELVDGKQYECDDTTPGDTTSDRQIIITTASAAITGTIKTEVYYVCGE